MAHSIGDDFNGQLFRVADGFLPGGAVRHHTRQFEGFGDPAAVVFSVDLNREVHVPYHSAHKPDMCTDFNPVSAPSRSCDTRAA